MVVDTADRGGRLFDCSERSGAQDLQREPMRDFRAALAAMGHDLQTLDSWNGLADADLVLFHVLDKAALGECLRRGLGERTAYLAWEPPVVQPLHEPEGLALLSRWFGRILTWQERVGDHGAFLPVRAPHALGPVSLSPLAFSERGLLVNISSNRTSRHPLELYSERERVVDGFEASEPGFELWGRGWNLERHPSWRGPAPSKREVYHRFRFALCLENMRDAPGYSTEKLFDALAWDTVPVYQGDPRLVRVLPPEAFVDYAAFGSPEALREHLSSWSGERHASARAAGREFLRSPAAHPWSGAALADSVATCLALAASAPRRPTPSLADRARLEAARLARLLRNAAS